MKKKLYSLSTIIFFIVGCQSAAKLTPDQLSNIERMGALLTQVAKENNVTANAKLTLKPLEMGLKEAVYVDGVLVEVWLTANPPATK